MPRRSRSRSQSQAVWRSPKQGNGGGGVRWGMERFFDEFSKQLAGAASRRDAFKVTGSALLSMFLTSTSVGKAWGAISLT
jgi:hypothetical protein